MDAVSPQLRGHPQMPRKKRSNRSNRLTISVSPRTVSVARNTTSPDVASRSTSAAAISPESPLGASITWLDQASGAGSSGTVRGPERGNTPPLTPFPPWISESEEEDGQWDGNNVAAGRRRVRSGHSVQGGGSVMHSFVLAVQSIVSLAVFSALACVLVWEDESDKGTEEWLWKIAQPGLMAITILCSATLIAHEVKVLSSVAHLYLQALILALTTMASGYLWVKCLGEESRHVKGVIMGCSVMIWGLALFGFLRAVVVWKVEGEGSDEASVGYGTFVPWEERRGSE